MAHFAHIYGLIAEANMDVMLEHYGVTTLVNATYEDKSEKLANVIGTQAKSGAPFYLPDRLDQIDKDLKDIRDDLKRLMVKQDYHTELFEALFKHFGLPLPTPPPTPPTPPAQPAAPAP